MRYLKGDVVEVITAKYKSYNDIPEHERGYFDNQFNGVAPVIGQKFRLLSVHIKDNLLYTGRKEPFRIEFVLAPDNVILFKRPILNWIKYALLTIFNIK